MDRISNLPDELICHIGSFLSADDAASAMVLSKRWRNLFTIVPKLCCFYMNEERFTDFTNEIIALPLDSRIRKLALMWGFEYIEPADMDCCLSHALKHGIVDLELLDVTIQDEEGDKYSLPLEVFTCETVAKLSLSGKSIPAKAYLPSLKILKLYYVRIYELNTLLSACPVLEELLIYDFREWRGSRSVSSQTMKRLTLKSGIEVWEYYDEPEFQRISFDTPALTYLNYSDFARKEYPIVNLSSLVEAKLRIYKEEGILSDPINFFNGLKNIKILSVNDKTMELIHDFRKAVPMFENLSHLTLVNKENCCWFGLRVLLQKSPKLKTLTVKGSLHCDKFYHFEPLCECLLGYSFLLTCRIEVLKITKFKGSTGEMSQLKQVLEKLLYLELLEIRTVAGNEDERMKDLLTIPRASSKCKIKVVTRFAQVCDEKDEEKEAKSGRCEASIPK